MKKKVPRTYYRKAGYIFIADHVLKTVFVPLSYDEEHYPIEILDYIRKDKYYKKLSVA